MAGWKIGGWKYTTMMGLLRQSVRRSGEGVVSFNMCNILCIHVCVCMYDLFTETGWHWAENKIGLSMWVVRLMPWNNIWVVCVFARMYFCIFSGILYVWQSYSLYTSDTRNAYWYLISVCDQLFFRTKSRVLQSLNPVYRLRWCRCRFLLIKQFVFPYLTCRITTTVSK